MAQRYASPVLRSISALFTSGTAGVLSDEQLLERLGEGRQAGAEAAFEALLVRHGGMVWSVCRNVLHNANDAEDAFQASFLVLLRKSSSIRKRGALSSWLHGVAYRIAVRSKATAKRFRSSQDSPLDNIALPSNASDELALLHEELNRLPEKYRAPVLLFYFEGHSSAQVAQRLGWPVGTVTGRLSRARDILRGRLIKRGLAPALAFAGSALADKPARAAVPQRVLEQTLATFCAGPAHVSLLAPAVTSAVAALSQGAFPASSLLSVKWAAAVVLAGLTFTAAAGMGEQDAAPGEARAGQAVRVDSQAPSQEAPAAAPKPANSSETVGPGKSATRKVTPAELASLQAERKLKQGKLAEAEAKLELASHILSRAQRLRDRIKDVVSEEELKKDEIEKKIAQAMCDQARAELEGVDARLNLAQSADQDAKLEAGASRDFAMEIAKAELAALEAQRKAKEAELQQAEAKLAVATNARDATRRLHQQNVVAAGELTQVESEAKAAQAAVAIARAKLEEANVRLELGKRAVDNPETVRAWLEHSARPSSIAPLENRLSAVERKLDQILEVLSRQK